MTDSEDTKSENDGGFMRRILGVLCFPLALFPLFALLTYNWKCVAALNVPPLPTANLIGVMGDMFAYWGYAIMGLTVWVIPLFCVVEGILLIFGRRFYPTRRLLSILVLVFGLTCFLQLISAAAGVHQILHALNIGPNAGGAIGYLVMTHGLSRLMSPFGSGVFMICLILISLVMLIGPKALAGGVRSLTRWTMDAELTPEEQRARDEKKRKEEEAKAALMAAKEAARADRLAEKERAAAERKRAAEEKAAQKQREAEERAAARERLAAEKSAVQAPIVAPVAAPTVAPMAAPIVAPLPPDKTPSANQAAAPEAPPAEDKGPYLLPPMSLLNDLKPSNADHGDVDALAQKLVDTLKLFSIESESVYNVRGPVVTKFALRLSPGTKPDAVKALTSTLQMSLKAKSLRIQAPIPGEDAVGIEVPNVRAASVSFREIMESEAWQKNVPWPAKGFPKYQLPLLLGKNAAGQDLVADLASMPHLLVAGATGQGKSVCLNSIICGLLMSRTPEQLKLIMVDPKCVEFSAYAALPHLLVPVVTDNKKVVYSLRWAVSEMEKRLRLFASVGKRNIVDFNSRATVVTQPNLFGGEEMLAPDGVPATVPYIVIIIDEVADLMASDGKDVEPQIARLAAKARATGIHLILATQRPDTKTITGTIKSNIPGRIAFKTSQGIDSRTILDATGAEQLIGRGDMLFKSKDGELVRAQGSWVADEEIARITDFISEHANVQFDQKFASKLAKVKEAAVEDPFADNPDDPDNQVANEEPTKRETSVGGARGEAGGEDSLDEELYERALEVVRMTGRASTSHLQRRMRIGYNHAARMMELLEERGVVGPVRGAGPREILIDLSKPMGGEGTPTPQTEESGAPDAPTGQDEILTTEENHADIRTDPEAGA